MPLFHSSRDAATYFFRERIFLDPDTDNVNPAPGPVLVTNNDTQFTRRVFTPSRPNHIASLEVTQYCVPKEFTPMIWPVVTEAGYGGNAAKSVQGLGGALDVHIAGFGGQPDANFTMYLPALATRTSVRNFWLDEFPTYLAAAAQQLAEGGAIDATWVNLDVTSTADEPFANGSGRFGGFAIKATQGVGLVSRPITFLFATGPNAASNPAVALGFDAGVDTGPRVVNGTSYTGPITDRFPAMYDYRAVDLTFGELPNLQPHSRFFTTSKGDFFRSENNTQAEPRLLTEPLRRSDVLTVTWRLRDGLIPNLTAGKTWLLTLDALLTSPETTIPCWVWQKGLFGLYGN